MFTGLVEGVGIIKSIGRKGGGMILSITPPFDLSEIKIGDSIAVDGVCLTATGIDGKTFSVDVSGETLDRSTLGHLTEGTQVNLERALRLSDRLGGHLVSGHVDGMGKVLEKEKLQSFFRLKIGLDKTLARYTIEKGSITIDGISLTINKCGEAFVELQIIPQTGKETHLLNKKTGDSVNIETDLIGKYVEKFFRDDQSTEEQGKSLINREMLIKYGFGE